MKCKIFIGQWHEAQDAFNKWAKGKKLGKDVIIHEQTILSDEVPFIDRLAIIVYHPDDPFWDKTEPQLTAPVHQEPEPHVCVEEMNVT